MTRCVTISDKVSDKLADVVAYLKNDLEFSEEAASAYRERFVRFIRSLGNPADYALCRFKKWRKSNYRCAVFEKEWVFAYETFDDGVILRDMSHVSVLNE